MRRGCYYDRVGACASRYDEWRRHLNARARRLSASVAAVLACFIVGAGWAFACVPQVKLVYVQPNAFGPGGSAVSVNAIGIDPGPAEIRWNGPEGPLLGSATGPNLSVPVTIPIGDPGLYQIVVLTRGNGGVLAAAASSTFLVTPDKAGQSPPAQPERTTNERASSGPGIAGVAAGGVALVAVGTVAGVAIGRRRRRPPVVDSAG